MILLCQVLRLLAPGYDGAAPPAPSSDGPPRRLWWRPPAWAEGPALFLVCVGLQRRFTGVGLGVGGRPDGPHGIPRYSQALDSPYGKGFFLFLLILIP